MFFKKRINNYSYLNNIQSNGSVIKSFDSISCSFINNSTLYLTFLIRENKKEEKPFLFFSNIYLNFFFYNKKKKYLNNFHLFFINNKHLDFTLHNFFLKAVFSNISFYIYIKKKKKKGKKSSKIIKKKKLPSLNMDCYIYNNLFILKILESYRKKIIDTVFFNI